ncbi:MAG TPA: sigma-70 family RNA polymerase sigma factor [Candidatus Acidoferrum sp.]|nr:sigma-70 family RNA polymerase sigma factor [Candidatus Acidoferrum sp.]
MATDSTLLPAGDTQLRRSLNEPRPICSEYWTECYAAHYRYVLQVCKRYFRQPEDAEDAAAEVFLKLYRVLHQRDATVPFRPWLSQVAGHHCVDKLRRRKGQKNSSLEDNDLSGFADHSTPSPLSQVLRKEEQRRVREQLIRLPAKYKVPLVLRYYKRMSYSQIARTMNRGLPAVRMMIFRAKDQLRRNLYAVPVKV